MVHSEFLFIDHLQLYLNSYSDLFVINHLWLNWIGVEGLLIINHLLDRCRGTFDCHVSNHSDISSSGCRVQVTL